MSDLWKAGRDSKDALDIVNSFYTYSHEQNSDINDDYWVKKVCVLAERIVAAEKTNGNKKQRRFRKAIPE